MTLEIANNPGGAGEARTEELANAADVAGDETEVETTEAEDGQTETDDTDELEHEGQKARVPKWVKAGWMMQSDYTKKTQEVALARQGLEDREKRFGEQTRLQQQLSDDYATVRAMDKALEHYARVDWYALRQQSPEQAQDQLFQYQQLKLARDNAAGELGAKVNKWQQDSAAENAKRLTESRAILARDIPGYSPETLGKMQSFATEFGFTPQQVAASEIDPGLMKLLHRAMVGDAAIKKAAKAAAAAKTVAAADAVKPTPQVGKGSATANKITASSTASDKLSGQEWLKRRNEELRRQRAQ